MTDPRYQPRDLSTEPDSFGRAATIRWKVPATQADAVRMVAAQMQHKHAVQIRTRLKVAGITLRAYAVAGEMKYERTAKVLRGEVIMRLEDIARADVVLKQAANRAAARASAQERARAGAG